MLQRTSTLLSGAILGFASLLGMAAFVYPFFIPVARGTDGGTMAHAADAPLVFVLLILLCLAAAFAALGSQQMTSKMVALLGILTALSAVLRALPGPGGFNALFLLPILAGYCYGPTFGFLLGALSLLVSALIGGGVGPWLPYQMFATGWVGLLSGWLPRLLETRPRLEVLALGLWGAVLGLVFGAIMNLWFWPYLSPALGAAPVSEGGAWSPGMALWTTLRNYLVFYTATSLWWDVARAGGNAVLLWLLAGPVLRVLRRFRRRFRFDVMPEIELNLPA